MFYSQFILAKKGPLGTIWIAAHLERKLRKNQVADTDIGVSVDSILFPDVPIALRLSSHLLLGVVRIYSRKVNYLFDDCSEALLKIKQAFRSTAVDLAPEESTAPYHSITLPETFDLDDFELPDNDIFQGNYVDHHVSTKEQITLQDSMDGVVYSTSQFGLDERFGDGDASHVGLDLEEDMFLDNVAAPCPQEVRDANPQASVASPARISRSSAFLPVNGTSNKIGDHDADLEFMEYAEAPSTPGLINEPNLSSVQEGLACDDHLESEDHNLTESVRIERADNASIKLDHHHGDGAADLSPGSHANYDTIEPMAMGTVEFDRVSADLELNKENVKGKLPAEVAVKYLEADQTVSALYVGDVEDINKVTYNNESSVTRNGECGEDVGVRLREADVMDSGNEIEGSESHGKTAIREAQAPRVPEEPHTLNNHTNNEQSGLSSMSVLRSCSFFPGLVDASSHGSNDTAVRHPDEPLEDVVPCTSGKDEAFHSSGTSKNIEGGECFITDTVQAEESQLFDSAIHTYVLEDEAHDNLMTSNNQFGRLDGSQTSELPAPEKLLSVPQMPPDKLGSFLIESTPEKDVQEECDGAGTGSKVSGKKRTFTDSTLPVQSLSSVETFGMGKSRRTVKLIPDDDDLLSSILAGRSSSVLKIKPSPAPEAVSTKCVRSSSRVSSMKRKVLVDDSMVLLGDTIRQQLTNTEDIRRLRKKAPCTRTEILIIQRQFLEEEIFNEAVLTGMAMKLARLHSEKFDLSRIEIAETDDNTVSLEVGKGKESSPRPTLIGDSEVQGDIEPVTSREITDEQSADLRCEGHWLHPEGRENHGHISAIAGISDVRTLEFESLGEKTQVEIDKANCSLVLETVQTELVSRSIINMPAEAPIMDKSIGEDVSLPMDTSCIPSDELDALPDGDNPCLGGTISGKDLDGMDILNECTDNVAAVTTGWGAEEEILIESRVDKSIEIMADVQAAGNSCAEDVETSFVNAFPKTDACADAASLNVVEAPVDIGSYKPGFNNVDVGLAVNSGYDDKDQLTNYLCNEDCKVDTAYRARPDVDIKSGSLNDAVYLVGHEADQQSIMDIGYSGEHYTEGQYGDSQGVASANDTEFLNVDDDEMAEDDDSMPGAEDNRHFDNSGWSSRTRAVANYLQTLFDKEAEYGRRDLTMDNLLTGKTRKEASRMFFEALVLKTKDYIHVEQVKPFDNIRIKARAKLMKSDF